MTCNVISNCCVGAYTMRDILGKPFANPFCWSWINAADMLYLIDHFNEINFGKITISTYNNLPLADGVTFSVRIDGSVTVNYSHYQFNRAYHEPYADHATNMVFYDRMWEYVCEKYIHRVKRMLDAKDAPIFILLDDYTDKKFTTEQLEHVTALCKYKCMIFSSQHIISSNPNVSIVPITKDDMLPELITSRYASEIKHFLYLDS